MSGGRWFDDHEGVERPPVLEVLDRADRTVALPRLGGMARADGVVIVSERYWAFAGVDGTLREGRMPSPPASLRHVPLVRGLVRLGSSLSPLFRGTGVARRRERLFLTLAVLAPLGLVFVPDRVGLVIGLALTGGLIVWLLRGRTLFLHGAEHRAIAAAEHRQLGDTWAGVVRPSRFSTRCGTNFAALLLPVATLGQRVFRMEPESGFAAQAAAGTTIYLATKYGYPLSTTHVVSGAVMGAGATKRLSAVRWGVAGNIVVAWVLTLPAAAAVAAAFYWPIQGVF